LDKDHVRPTASGYYCILKPSQYTYSTYVLSPVRVLQTALNVCYGRGLTVDGRYGVNTARAVQYVQARAGLTADGVFGPATRARMSWPARSDWGASSQACYRYR